MRKLVIATSLFFVISGISASSCSDSNHFTVNFLPRSKTNSALRLQVSLRKQQLASPTADRLAQMRAQGMNTTNLRIQKIYIYLTQQLTPAQTSKLQALGITIYLDSWIPPAGNNPNGFYLADIPVDELDALSAKQYVVKLDKAEQLLQPQSDLTKGN